MSQSLQWCKSLFPTISLCQRIGYGGLQLQSVRTTYILKRKFPPQTKKRDNPKLTNKHHIYELVKHTSDEPIPPLDVVLLEDLEGIGKRGILVTVPRYIGRNYLLPMGIADYASPENLKKFNIQTGVEEKTKEDVWQELTAEKLSGLNLGVLMSKNSPWQLNEDILRVTLRRRGVTVKSNDCIVMPEEPVTEPHQEFQFGLKVTKDLEVKVSGKTYPYLERMKDKKLHSYPPTKWTSVNAAKAKQIGKNNFNWNRFVRKVLQSRARKEHAQARSLKCKMTANDLPQEQQKADLKV